MPSATIRHEVSLEPRALFDIPDAAGLELVCAGGTLWVTLDDDPRDIVLERGESFTGTEHRRALVYAFGHSTLEVRQVKPALRGKPRLSPLFSLHGRTAAVA
jgi:hypothetical protein